jgi:hypothetical protein
VHDNLIFSLLPEDQDIILQGNGSVGSLNNYNLLYVIINKEINVNGIGYSN